MTRRNPNQPSSRVYKDGKWKYNYEYEKVLRLKNPERAIKQKLLSSLWQRTHQEETSWKTLRYYYKIKAEIFNLLGNKCNNPECPIPIEKLDPRCLQIDHVNGGGCSAKRSKENPSCYSYYKRILEEIKAGSKNYQLLCVYCNWQKRFLNKELYRKHKEMPH